MNNTADSWVKRAVGITLLATFLILSIVAVWGMGFSKSTQDSSVISDGTTLPAIAPVSDTQPGGADDASVATSQSSAGNPGSTAGSSQPAAPTTTTQQSTGGSPASPTNSPTTAPTTSPTAPPAACGSGGVCHMADIQGHNTSGDCRTAINIDGTVSAYAPSSSFLSSHGSEFKQIVGKMCGKVYTQNLRQSVSEHGSGSLNGSSFQQYLNNFYIGPYN